MRNAACQAGASATRAPARASVRRRTFTGTLQPRERPAERSTSAPKQDRRGAGPSTSPPAQLATALLRRSAAAPPARRRRSTRHEHAVQRTTPLGKHRASRWRELGGAGRAARRASPRPAVPSRTLTPAHPARRRSSPWQRARVRCACGAETGAGVASEAAQPPVAGSKRAAAGLGERGCGTLAGGLCVQKGRGQGKRCAGAGGGAG
jgi:hypothetical protein